MKRITHWIGGKPWTGEAANRGDIYNPATGQVTGTVDFASAAEVGVAVQVATGAFADWRETSLTKRANILFTFRQLLVEHPTSSPPSSPPSTARRSTTRQGRARPGTGERRVRLRTTDT